MKECEARFAVLDAASQGAAAVQAQVRSLTEQAARAVAGAGAAGRGGAAHRRRCARTPSTSRRWPATPPSGCSGSRRSKPQLDEAVRQLATLKGTHEMMADGLEQMRLAQAEMTRVRESHAETQNWLTTTDGWTRKVEAQVKELRGDGAGGRADPRPTSSRCAPR